MRTKHYAGDSQPEQPKRPTNPPQPPIGRPAPSPDHEQLLALREFMLAEITRLKLIVAALPREEQVVLRALHGLDCKRFSVKQVARRLEISVGEVREIEARAIARVQFIYFLDEAA